MNTKIQVDVTGMREWLTEMKVVLHEAYWGVLLSPAFGALLMSLSTVIVAINAQLLNGWEDLAAD